jgi:hypothetical protein
LWKDQSGEIGTTYWKGIVKVDDSLDDFATSFRDFPDYKQVIIKDVKYHHEGLGYSWNSSEVKGTGDQGTYNPVYLWIVGKQILDYMLCSAVLAVHKVAKTRGVFRKETYYEDRFGAIGYLLEPALETPEIPVPRLCAYRASIGNDSSVSIHQKGIACFFTGSRSAETSEAARKSLTAVFIASKANPFTATVRQKGRAYEVKFDDDGSNEAIQDKGAKPVKKKTLASNDPLAALKLRLAKGEINVEEYERLRKVLES